MEKPIELTGMEIKCDAKGCDYIIPIEIKDTKSYMGKPCPKCGADLLTEEDYERLLAVLTAAEAHNIKALLGGYKHNPDETPVTVRVETHKEIKITPKP